MMVVQVRQVNFLGDCDLLVVHPRNPSTWLRTTSVKSVACFNRFLGVARNDKEGASHPVQAPAEPGCRLHFGGILACK
jgi:hypothetical protein